MMSIIFLIKISSIQITIMKASGQKDSGEVGFETLGCRKGQDTLPLLSHL